jgi:hypothetical protein
MINSSRNTRFFGYFLSCIVPPIGLFISMAYDEASAPEDKMFGRNCLISVYIGFGIYIGIAVYKLAELGVL